MKSEDRYEKIEAELRASRSDWERRLERIRGDRRRERGPLDPDSGDRAIERENDEALDALDEQGRDELAAIDRALDRLASGTFGLCSACGESIPLERLQAVPTAGACIGCARSG